MNIQSHTGPEIIKDARKEGKMNGHKEAIVSAKDFSFPAISFGTLKLKMKSINKSIITGSKY